MTESKRVILLTGLPTSFLAQKLLPRLLRKHPDAIVKCPIPDSASDKTYQLIQRLAHGDDERVEIIRGDVTSMDFGLSGKRFVALAREVDVVHHCMCANYGGVSRDAERRWFVNSTGEVLELALASEARLSRLVHWGSAGLSHPQHGRATETELRRPPTFRSRTDEMRFRAEVLIRDAMNRAPITILRPSIMIGDSQTGEIDPTEAPYALFQWMLNPQLELRVPVPGRGDQPCNFVPIDWVVDAGLTIADDPRSEGRTFHLTDEQPLSIQRVFDLITESVIRPATVPRLPRNLAALILHAPGADRLALVPKPFLELLATDLVYDARNARELLAGMGVTCPNLTSYLKTILATVQRDQEARGRPRRVRRSPQADDMEDPLDT